ncbi:MAG: T9SS type A sorting domain-containing protein [Flavobacteriaceae bacterium]|jgi:hypothetical protein|nr:T9SS type A sorting domain-containing protein [Flavobacteriaceae bacterium]
MKKQLLFLGLFVGSFLTSNAQLLESDNYENLTIGNVGTAVTGLVAGQGGMFTLNSAGGTNSDNSNYQIAGSDFVHLNVLQITSSDAATGGRFLWKSGLAASWAARTPGNDVVELEFSFNTGAATASTNSFRGIIYGADGNAIGGYSFNMNTKRLDGYAFGDFNATGTPGNYLITLRSGGLILPADTWVKVGFAYNSFTGRFQWKCNDVTPALYGGIDGDPDYIVDEFDYIFSAGAANATASTVLVDDYTVKAKATESLLGNTKNELDSKVFSVYPNPAKNVINVANTTDALISAVEITDLNGRIVKSANFSNLSEVQLAISDLAQGVYTMKIVSDKGITVKKVIKE